MPTEKRAKLRGRLAALASEKIAEEVRSRRYPTRAQAVAVGISRAKTELKKETNMPKQTIDPTEVEGIEYLVKTTFQYLQHPDVEATVPKAPTVRRKLDAVWSLAWTHLQQHPSRPSLSRDLAAKLSFAAQEAADVLDEPRVRKIPFAANSSLVARPLRTLVARLKVFRR